MATIKARLNLRTDTAAAWGSANPVLLAGEIAFESDTKKLRVGDGTSAYTALPFVTLFTTPPDFLLKTGGIMTGLITGAAVQSSMTDATAGRLMPVGAFGLGGATSANLSNLDSFTTRGGAYWITTGVAGTRPPGSTFQAVVVTSTAAVGNIVQVATDLIAPFGRSYRVGIAAVWSAWQSLSPSTLSQVQAENPASTVAGLVTGQRLAQAAAVWGYTSAQTTIPGASTAVTFTHGLGARPTRFQVVLQCTTSEHGYAIGDEIMLSGFENAGASAEYNGTISANATAVYYSQNNKAAVNRMIALPRGGGASVILTDANWRLVARASL